MECSKCRKNKELVNKHFKLCQGCNNERLHGSKYGKSYTNTKLKIKPLRKANTKPKQKNRKSLYVNIKSGGRRVGGMFEQDNQFYEESFNLSDHKCEECGTQLPTEFRDEDGKIQARWRYSHIIPKSIASEIRHDLNNINHLCLKCHSEWENGNKSLMKIFRKNYLKFSKYLTSWNPVD